MKRTKNSIIKNEFFTEPEQVHAIGEMLNTMFDDMFENTDNELGHLKGMKYIHVLLGYGDWNKAPDILGHVTPQKRDLIRDKRCFFIFDASLEGWSPFGRYSIFRYLETSCKKHNICPSMIIYLSSNLKDEENYKQVKHSLSGLLNVISYPAFETTTSADGGASYNQQTDLQNWKGHKTTLEIYHETLQKTDEEYKNKFFSSLSRINRPNRTIATYLLCQEKIAKRGLISHDRLGRWSYRDFIQWAVEEEGAPIERVNKWLYKLPMIVDRSDFNENWAVATPYDHIHNRTLFQIVNETLVDDENGTSLFYSEKTFRPILHFQPFVIYGQRDCNRSLKQLGYKTYEHWFDLSFDTEPDPVRRYKGLLSSVSKTCRHLKKLPRQEQIAWREDHNNILVHNYNVLRNSAYSKNKLYQFFKNLRIQP